ncbi:MAG: hypothetical protein IPO57_05025 [Rhodocyclales bacterium]|jgi:hypothetical protein|nr:hypothetical protein [Rhodocyclales bacterium]
MTFRPNLVMAALLALPPALAAAQTRPPVAQFWADVATHSMSIPGMDDMDEGSMGMFGGFFGGTKNAGGAPGKWLDTALHTRNKPSGTLGSHAIPPALNMGSALPLIPVQVERGRSEGEADMERPKGRLLFYWGCSETVRPGQPRVLDFARAAPDEYSKFMIGRFAPDRGAKAVAGRSVWPNEQDRKRVPANASLNGDHAVSGEGVPAGLRFAIGAAHDFMPKISLSAQGDPKGPINVGWADVNNARAYFLTAMGGKGEQEMIIWSSSEQPDPGWGLMDYLPPAQIERLLKERVILPTSTQRCAIPAGIFAGADGAMVRMIAYGPELNLAHPPRPANPKAPWNPEWAVRVRVKSTGMTMLGDEGGRGSSRAQSGQQKEESEGLPSPGNLLRGIFGR